MNAELRRYDDGDEDRVLDLLAGSLGWLPDDQHRAFFRWKHLDNPAGRSAMWVAEASGRIVGFRSMLRWRFEIDGLGVDAVRAVDTATAPEARGTGIFRALTLLAVDELEAEGVGFVFNTPNDQSRPGYLRMGWRELGRPPAAMRPRGVIGLRRAARSRVPADLWSVPTGAGLDAGTALSDDLSHGWDAPEPDAVSTVRSADHLRWRYAGLPSLAYRAVRTDDGLALFRLRRRGRATEAAVCELLAADRAAERRLLDEVARVSRADYTLRLGTSAPRARELPLPGRGPIVTWRSLAMLHPPAFERWRLSLGDVELL